MQTIFRTIAFAALIIPCALFSAWKPVPNQLQQYKTELEEIYERLNRSVEGNGNATAYLKATVTTKFLNNGELDREHSTFEMVASRNHMRWLSDEVKIFRDKRQTLMVFPDQKMIHCLSVGLAETYDVQQQHITAIQAQLFEFAEVEECEIMQRDGVQVNRVTLRLSKQGVHLLHIHQAQFEYEPATGKLLRQQIEFDKIQPIRVTRMEYHEMDMNYHDSMAKNDANSFVFDKHGNPLPAYRKYKVIDNRTIK